MPIERHDAIINQFGAFNRLLHSARLASANESASSELLGRSLNCNLVAERRLSIAGFHFDLNGVGSHEVLVRRIDQRGGWDLSSGTFAGGGDISRNDLHLNGAVRRLFTDHRHGDRSRIGAAVRSGIQEIDNYNWTSALCLYLFRSLRRSRHGAKRKGRSCHQNGSIHLCHLLSLPGLRLFAVGGFTAQAMLTISVLLVPSRNSRPLTSA